MRRFPVGTLLVATAVLAACSGGSRDDPVARSPSPTTPQPAVSSPKPCVDRTEHPFTLVMKDFRFVPECLVVSGTVPFHLRNAGTTRHNITIPGTKFSVDVPPGKTVASRQLMAVGVPPGTYRFYDRFHRSQGMTGELHVLAA